MHAVIKTNKRKADTMLKFLQQSTVALFELASEL